ncbi:MAG: D-alanine--D-alanine ligase [Clostridia bacterium]|nr:D-alanine--D-alanine ligase [Clostridia bacterium]
MNIVVLAGGLSPERNVSLVSGSLIAESLVKSGHKVLLLDVYCGTAIPEEGIAALFTDTANGIKTVAAGPDLDAVKKANGNRDELIGINVIEICKFADAVFLALHGAMGENGQLQATLDTFGVKCYSGSGYTGSSLAMNKEISKKLFRFAGVPTADWICVTCDDTAAKEKILASVGLPCVIKPLSCGSSVGVSIVDNEAELDRALELAHAYESKILAEKKIVGREFSVGYLGGTVLPPIEIIPKAGFYDYKNKYLPGMTEEICPADLTEEQVKRVSELCALAFETLDLGGYARIDFIMSEEDGDFYCLEANTLPGMTPSSLLPQEAAAVGISYAELCEKIVALAREKGRK